MSASGTVTYTLHSQSPDTTPKLFTIASASSAAVTTASADAFNAEGTTTSYTVVVRATDSGDSSTADLTITATITDCNEFTPVFRAVTVVIDGGETAGTEIITYAATDADATNTINTYAITGGNTDSVFEITSSGVVKVATSKTVPTTASLTYALVVTAVDQGTVPAVKTGTGTLSICVGSCPGSGAASISTPAALFSLVIIGVMSYFM